MSEEPSSSDSSLEIRYMPTGSRSDFVELPETIIASLKRRASLMLEDVQDDTRRKRLKEDTHDGDPELPEVIDGEALANDLEQELQCGCCSALVYRPVVVAPCQHFFCGSCCVLWIRNGGTNCPVCRGASTIVTPSRTLQKLVDLLLRAAPSRVRPAGERMQADEIYRGGESLRIPTPHQASPEPMIAPRNGNFVLPCPHCLAGNTWGWRCPQPIADPESDPDNAWNAEDGSPPGHGYCGNCENILALQAPTTTRCDFCQVSFCGIGVPGRCVPAPIPSQHPHGLSDLGDLLQCAEVCECFDHNSVEVTFLVDYLAAKGWTPRNLYCDIVAHVLGQPRLFAPLFEQELFTDVHTVTGGIDPDPSAPRNRICRVCATEVLLWGLRDWWIRERMKGNVDESVTSRPNCPEGRNCADQKGYAHAKEFNHIITPAQALPEAGEQSSSQSSGHQFNAPAAAHERVPSMPAFHMHPEQLHLSGDVSGLSSQEFRDEVDALL